MTIHWGSSVCTLHDRLVEWAGHIACKEEHVIHTKFDTKTRLKYTDLGGVNTDRRYKF